LQRRQMAGAGSAPALIKEYLMSVDKRIPLVLALVIGLAVGAGAVYRRKSRRRRSYVLRRASSTHATGVGSRR
jgi:hypothetical protein